MRVLWDPRRVGRPQGPRASGPHSEPPGRVRRGGASGARASTAASSRSKRDFPGSLGSSPDPPARKPPSWWKGRSNTPGQPPTLRVCGLFPRGEFRVCLLIPKLSSRVGGRTLLTRCAASQLRGAGNCGGGGGPHRRSKEGASHLRRSGMEEALGVESTGMNH